MKRSPSRKENSENRNPTVKKVERKPLPAETLNTTVPSTGITRRTTRLTVGL